MANSGDQSRGFTYDVFISFRGLGTRGTFIGYLHDALQKRGINAFVGDQNRRRGEDTTPAYLRAIEVSKISVIVFSQHYASSSWCLGELAKIIECTKRNNNQIALSIFYHVDPSDVRYQRKSYEEDMVAHQNRFGKDSENIKAWKAALSEAANLKGHIIHDHTGFENDCIKEIVEKVEAELAPKPSREELRRFGTPFQLDPLDHDLAPDAASEIESINQITGMISRNLHPVQTWLKLFNADNIWRLVGLVSSVVGLSCYALSPSFNRLIGTRKPFKFIPYGVLSLALLTTILFAKKSPSSTRHHQLKFYTTFAVSMIMSVYTFFYDRAVNGKPDILNVVSNAAFVLVSLSLHKLVNFGCEIGVFSYFLGCFAVQLFTINWMLILIAILFGCPLFVMHSSPNSQPEVASGGQVSYSSSNSRLVSGSDGQHVLDIDREVL